MLGKQGWNLLTNQDNLVSRQNIFQRKFPQLGHNPSFVKRSIHASWVVENDGRRWRIRNGNKIHIWGQPWLRAMDNAYVSTSPPMGPENQLNVSSLIDHHFNTWRVDFLQQIFSPSDSIEIQNIQLLDVSNENQLFWKF